MDLVEDVFHDVHAFRCDVVETNGKVAAAARTLKAQKKALRRGHGIEKCCAHYTEMF